MDDHMDTGSNSGASQDGAMEGPGERAGNRELLSDEESFSSPALGAAAGAAAIPGPSGLSAGASVVFAPRFNPSEVAQAVLAPLPPPQPAPSASRMDDDNLDEDNNSNLDLEGKAFINTLLPII